MWNLDVFRRFALECGGMVAAALALLSIFDVIRIQGAKVRGLPY